MTDDDEARRAHEIDTISYQEWIRRFDGLSREDKRAILDHIAESDLPVPLALFVFDAATAQFAIQTVKHLRKQLFSRFDAVLCFSDDCTRKFVDAATWAVEGDSRFTVAFTSQLKNDVRFAQERCILFAEGGVLLREHALYMFLAAAKERSPCLVYADEDRLDAHGIRRRPHFKPSFSPELLRRTGYIGPCALLCGVDFDPSVLVPRGGIRRAIEQLAQQMGNGGVANIPVVLYHDARASGPRRLPVDEVFLPEKELPSVSIIIPTKDKLDLLEPCVASVESRTNYPRSKLEIVVVDNGSEDSNTQLYLSEAAKRGAIRLVRDPAPFNYARLNNLGVQKASGEVVVLLNNDTVVNNPNWLRFLVGQAMQKDVGAVGAKLLYPNRTVQFMGTVLGLQGVAGHAHVGLREDDGGYRGVANVTREVGAVTGACLAIQRKIFEEVGGFDTILAVGCNDVLLCAELLARGYRNVCVGTPLLIHFESKTRGLDDTPEKVVRAVEEGRYLRSRQKRFFQNDPYYSPNLSYEKAYDIAFPPRRQKPWSRYSLGHGRLRILMLSTTNEMSEGLTSVVQMQSTHLARLGHEVLVGGPCAPQGVPFDDCRFVQLSNPIEAASYAVARDVDCIVAYTHPFFSVVRWIGDWPRCILCDNGERDRSFLADAEAQRRQEVEHRFCFGVADHIVTISAATEQLWNRDETLAKFTAVIVDACNLRQLPKVTSEKDFGRS